MSQGISHTEHEAEENIHFVTVNAVPKPITLTEIKDATEDDPTLCSVIHRVKEHTVFCRWS